MIVYNKEDRNFKIPNGIGNLNITINEDETTLTEELLKINSEIENINEDIDVLEGRVIDLENNNSTGGGGSSVVRIVAMDEILSVEDFNRIFDNPNNEVFELQFKYSSNDNYKTFTILTKEYDSTLGIKTIIFFDFMQRYKFLKYSFDDTTIYMGSTTIDSNPE